MSTKDISNIKLQDVTLIESRCLLRSTPVFGAKGMMKASVSSNFDIVEGDKKKISVFNIFVKSEITGYSVIEEKKASSDNEVFGIECVLKAGLKVTDGTFSLNKIKKMSPLFVALLTHSLREHIDSLIYKMNLSGSFSQLPIYSKDFNKSESS